MIDRVAAASGSRGEVPVGFKCSTGPHRGACGFGWRGGRGRVVTAVAGSTGPTARSLAVPAGSEIRTRTARPRAAIQGLERSTATGKPASSPRTSDRRQSSAPSPPTTSRPRVRRADLDKLTAARATARISGPQAHHPRRGSRPDRPAQRRLQESSRVVQGPAHLAEVQAEGRGRVGGLGVGNLASGQSPGRVEGNSSPLPSAPGGDAPAGGFTSRRAQHQDRLVCRVAVGGEHGCFGNEGRRGCACGTTTGFSVARRARTRAVCAARSSRRARWHDR